MKPRLNIILPATIIVLVLGIITYRTITAGASPEARRANAVLVKVDRPVREAVTYALQFTGDMVAVQQASIFSKVTGNLEQVFVDMGTPVKRNQLLALIDTTELFQQYQQAAATYQNARLQYLRNKELGEQNLISKQEIDNAEAAMKVAKAAYESALTRLGYAFIRAPFAGVITRRFFDPGATVTNNNSTLFTLMDIKAMKVTVNVLERDIPLIKEGKKATIVLDAYPGKKFEGRVERYSQALDVATRTMAVEIDVPNASNLLKPGMFANVTLVVDQHEHALTVPTESILKDDNGAYLFVVEQDSARQVRVVTGAVQDNRTEILSGLSGSEQIIVTGQQFVRGGGPVSIQQ